MSVTVTKDATAALERAVRDLVKNQVLVGVPAEGASRQPEEGEKSAPTNAQIGYWMEYGAPEANIPARPHLMPGIERAQDAITARLARTGEAALTGSREAVDQGLNAVGLVAQNAVRREVTDGAFAPLAKRTIQRRQAKGRTGTKPLIDTGQYRRSLTYVIRPKGA